MKTKKCSPSGVRAKRSSIWKDHASWELLLLCVPAIIGYILFNYIPMAIAIAIPFQDYKFSLGVAGSKWIGLSNFSWLIHSESLWRVIRNTLSYSIWFMIIVPIIDILFALLLFEVKKRSVLKFYQTVITFPNFMSMVIVGYITYAILSPTTGILSKVMAFFGMKMTDVYTNASCWPAILTIVNLWKSVGIGSMMYFAALMGIDVSLYEAAEIDGANRWQKMRYISLPQLVPLICIFTILAAGGLFNGNFDLFYVIPRDVGALYSTTDILPTYVYRALKQGTYASGATVSLFQSVTGLLLVLTTNFCIKKISPDNSLF